MLITTCRSNDIISLSGRFKIFESSSKSMKNLPLTPIKNPSSSLKPGKIVSTTSHPEDHYLEIFLAARAAPWTSSPLGFHLGISDRSADPSSSHLPRSETCAHRFFRCRGVLFPSWISRRHKEWGSTTKMACHVKANRKDFYVDI